MDVMLEKDSSALPPALRPVAYAISVKIMKGRMV